MSKYNDQYYIVFKSYDENTLYLTTHDRSDHRDFEYTKLSGSEPMFFENGYRDEDLSRGIARPIKQAHMSIAYPVISDEVKITLGDISNDFCQLYPAVIIDDSDKYHDNYWVFNIFEEMDALDLEKCHIDDFDPEDEEHPISQYYLDDEKLSAMPEKERLVFMPKYTDYPHVMVHEKVVKAFKKHDVDTLNFVKVSDWVMGLQFVES
ncbi:imm11 family protein [Vibrio vulnificus]|uniref:imm11 family protein n=1 Tax=Vibrio vulnificus TaxID=672 RepID=UPI003ED9072C